MFAHCSDPKSLEGFAWLVCYLTTIKHFSFYISFGTVILLMMLAAPTSLAFGFMGAFAKRSTILPIRWFGQAYTAMVRGVPDIIFFLFVPIAIDQGLEWLRHKVLCPEVTGPIRQGNDFVVCTAAKLPLSTADAWVHDVYGFALAVVAYSIVFGAFAANVLDGALKAVPKGQLEAGQAIGMSPAQIMWRIHLPQMWVFALPGLSNLWMILIKATPLLFLLGVEDVVYWAKELGGLKTQVFAYPHGDWRVWYFLALLVFYLLFTWVSEKVFARLTARASRGQATAGGAAAGARG
ncbi:ABC transporter permease subunit [Rhodobacteraceae bacterium NNCM2]|nr:ABC transporter permease subunit [Coraliihabitans acroporae]